MLKMDNIWLTSVHVYILNDGHTNSNSGGHERMTNQHRGWPMTSTNEEQLK